MAKVVRAGSHGIQMIRARELVPGDIVEVSGGLFSVYYDLYSEDGHAYLEKSAIKAY